MRDMYLVQIRACNWPHKWETMLFCSSRRQTIKRAETLTRKGYTVRVRREYMKRVTVWPKPTK